MNGRLYDPMTRRFLSPDNYVQDPYNTQNFNRYGYVYNSPLMFNDPSGEIIVAVLIGAAIGAYMGGVIANGGQFNPSKWDYSSGKTWGYILGGAIIGGLSGGLASSISTSGVAFANTGAIFNSSFFNSIAMGILTQGETDITASFGIFSINLSKGSFGYLGKKGNGFSENLGFGLGAIANFNDFMIGFDSSAIGEVDLITENSDAIGHSALVDVGTIDNYDSIISFGPPARDISLNPFKNVRGSNNWSNYSDNHNTAWRTTIKGLNRDKILNYGMNLSNNTPKYNLYFSSCVTHTSRALTKSGFFNIGIHPYLLQGQVYLRHIGLRNHFSHYLQNKL